MVIAVSSTGLAALIDRASRLIHSLGFAEGLYPAQWVALRYFREAPPSSRTTAALAHYQGMSLGPVARTVRTLVEKGLLARVANPASRRADLITVTATGRATLINDPRLTIAAVVKEMPLEQQVALANTLEIVIPALLGDYPVSENKTNTPRQGG